MTKKRDTTPPATTAEVLQEIEILSHHLGTFELVVSSYLRSLSPEQAQDFDFRELPYLVTRACRLKQDIAQQGRKLSGMDQEVEAKDREMLASLLQKYPINPIKPDDT